MGMSVPLASQLGNWEQGSEVQEEGATTESGAEGPRAGTKTGTGS